MNLFEMDISPMFNPPDRPIPNPEYLPDVEIPDDWEDLQENKPLKSVQVKNERVEEVEDDLNPRVLELFFWIMTVFVGISLTILVLR